MAKKKRSVRRTPSGLSRLSVSDLEREIRRREQATKSLHRKRAKLLEKVAAIDEQILTTGGSLNRAVALGRTGRTRPKNETNLIDALRAVLKDKTMGVAEAAEAVQKAGYRSSSPNFRTMVNAALIKKKLFKRVERGRYTAA